MSTTEQQEPASEPLELRILERRNSELQKQIEASWQEIDAKLNAAGMNFEQFAKLVFKSSHDDASEAGEFQSTLNRILEARRSLDKTFLESVQPSGPSGTARFRRLAKV